MPLSPVYAQKSTLSDEAIAHLHDRRLLGQVKLGRGTALKALRQYVDDHPVLEHKHKAKKVFEAGNEKQRTEMMWVKDANSRTKRVEGAFRDECTYTSTVSSTWTVPDPALVQRCKLQDEMKKMSSKKGTQGEVRVPSGLLPLPGLVREIANEQM